ASGAVMVAADMPSSYSYTFSASNIEGGRVTSEGASRSTRYTVAQVTYNDMTDFGRAKLEVVEDEEGMQRYGVRITQIKPIGCTSRGQAQRYGRWALTTAKLQADVSSFVTGLEHAVVAPGRIIRVSDPHLAG